MGRFVPPTSVTTPIKKTSSNKQLNLAGGEPRWRKMASADLPQVLQIERNTQAAPWSRLAFEEALTRSESCEGQVDAIAPYICQVLSLQDGNDAAPIIGFSIVSTVVDEAHILNVAVALPFQGEGLGHALMDDIFEHASAHNLSKIFLEVRVSNTVAQGLYRKWGFEQLAIRKDYYRTADQGREDALVFCRQLGNTVRA